MTEFKTKTVQSRNQDDSVNGEQVDERSKILKRQKRRRGLEKKEHSNIVKILQ